MSTPLKTLIIEDSEDDAALLLMTLEEGGFQPIHQRVETPEEMAAALESQSWDVVLSDYMMPRFDALAALSILQGKKRDIPFIIVSGKIGEETATAPVFWAMRISHSPGPTIDTRSMLISLTFVSWRVGRRGLPGSSSPSAAGNRSSGRRSTSMPPSPTSFPSSQKCWESGQRSSSAPIRI